MFEMFDTENENENENKEPQFIVVGNGFTSKSVYYYGDSEIEAYKNFKRACIKGKANIYKALVYTCELHGVTMIERYEILETIK